MLDASAIKAVAELAQRGQTVQFFDVPVGGRAFYYHLPGQEKPVLVKASPPPQRVELATVAEFQEFAASHNKLNDTAAIFLAQDRFLLLFEEQDPRCYAVMRPTLTAPYKWLQACGGKFLLHAEFIRVLRITFNGAIDDGPVRVLRNLKFNTQSETGVEIANDRSSISRKVEEKVTGAGGVPEEIAVRLNVFEEYDAFEFAVDCALEVDAGKGLLALTPYPGQLSAAMEATLLDIKRQLSEGGTLPPIHLGRPLVASKDEIPF